jgi:hypothetical protein
MITYLVNTVYILPLINRSRIKMNTIYWNWNVKGTEYVMFEKG